jgi:hypothetical protein
MRLFLFLAVLAVACTAAMAQRAPGVSQAPGPQRPTVGLEGTRSDDAFPSRITGTIVAVNNARRLMMIERADKSRLTLAVDPKVRARADKDTPLAGRKDLSLSDYKSGQVVSVSYRAADNTAVEIRLKRPRS